MCVRRILRLHSLKMSHRIWPKVVNRNALQICRVRHTFCSKTSTMSECFNVASALAFRFNFILGKVICFSKAFCEYKSLEKCQIFYFKVNCFWGIFTWRLREYEHFCSVSENLIVNASTCLKVNFQTWTSLATSDTSQRR